MLNNVAELTHQETSSQRVAQKLDIVTDVLQKLMIGKFVETDKDHALFVNNLSAWFKREPHLLQSSLRYSIASDLRMRNVLFSLLVDVPQLEEIYKEQALSLKFGGNISDKRWGQHFSPILQRAVEIMC